MSASRVGWSPATCGIGRMKFLQNVTPRKRLNLIHTVQNKTFTHRNRKVRFEPIPLVCPQRSQPLYPSGQNSTIVKHPQWDGARRAKTSPWFIIGRAASIPIPARKRPAVSGKRIADCITSCRGCFCKTMGFMRAPGLLIKNVGQRQPMGLSI
jgi:hypothetical protein